MCDMTNFDVCHDSSRCVAWLVPTCHATFPCCLLYALSIWHGDIDMEILSDVFEDVDIEMLSDVLEDVVYCMLFLLGRVVWRVHSHVWNAYVLHTSFIRIRRLISRCDITHSDVCDALRFCRLYAFRLWMCDLTCAYAFICMTFRMHMCGMPHSYVWRDSFRCLAHAFDYISSFHHYTHTHKCTHTHHRLCAGFAIGCHIHTTPVCMQTGAHTNTHAIHTHKAIVCHMCTAHVRIHLHPHTHTLRCGRLYMGWLWLVRSLQL